METLTVHGQDALPLQVRFFPATNGAAAAPTILWVHGAFEHSGRFLPHLQRYADRGFQSITYDQRGHGKSGGKPMTLRGLDQYLSDLTQVAHHFQDRINGPLYLFGHSMGGLVVLRHRQQYPDAFPITSTVLSSPFLGIAAPVPAWKRVLSKVIVGIAPDFAVPADLNPAHISHDPAEVAAYKNDALVHTNATAGWFEAITAAHVSALAEAPSTPGPLHILMAGDDKLVSTAATKRFYEKLPAGIEKSLREFEGFYHEGLNETHDRREEFYTALDGLLATPA